jgi:hypothetical protein
MNDPIDKLVAFQVRVLAQESIHLLDMHNTLQVPNHKTRHVRFGRFALENGANVKLQHGG